MALELDIASNTRKFMAGVDDVEEALAGVSGSLDGLAAASDASATRAGDSLADGIRGGAEDAERAVEQVDDTVADLARTVGREADEAGDQLADGIEDGADRAGKELVLFEGKFDDLATDVGREADQAGDKLADGIEDGADKAGKELVKFERKFADLQQAAKRESSKIGDDLGSDVKRGTKVASEGVEDFKNESRQNAEEVAASFDGSAESIADGFQGLAASAFVGFGPAGLLAGAALAAGIGLGSAGFEKNQEATEELQAKLSELVAEYIEAGTVGERSMSGVADTIRALAEATGDGEENLGSLAERADKTGLPFDKLARAFAGDADALDELIRSTDEHIDKAGEQLTSVDDGAGGLNRASTATERQRDALLELRDKLAEVKGVQDQATEAVELYAQADDGLARRAEAQAEYTEAVQEAYGEAGAAVSDFVTDAGFDLDGYNAAMEASAEAINNYQQNVVTASQTLSADALAYIQSLGPDSAPALQAFIDAPLDQQQRTAANWDSIGKTSSTAFSSKLNADLAAATYTSDVKMYPDMSAITAELQKQRSISIIARVSRIENLPGTNPARNGMGVP